MKTLTKLVRHVHHRFIHNFFHMENEENESHYLFIYSFIVSIVRTITKKRNH